MTRYDIYEKRHNFEFLQVLLAWCLCYLWLLPYLLIIALVVLLLFALADKAASVGDADIGLLILGLGLVGILGSHIPAVHLFIRIIKTYRVAKDISHLEILSARHSDLVKSRLDTLIGKIPDHVQGRFRGTSLCLLIERRNHKATPCMVVRKGKIKLILSLGFFKVMSSDPEAADAMLAHEMAHFLQRDSSFLLAVRSYLKASRIMFFYVLVGFAMGMVFAIVSWGSLAEKRKEVLTHQHDSSSMYYYTIYGPVRGPAIGAPSLQQIDREQLRVVLQVVGQFSSIPSYFLFGLYLRRRVRRSEMLADLFAAITTTPAAVNRFLQGYVADTDERSSLHPPVGRRMKYIAKLASQYST
jgi:Zn-dependent protease with chaperone function